MKYTQKPTKQVLASIKNRKLLIAKNKAKDYNNGNIRKSMNESNINSLQEEDLIGFRKNTGSSVSGFNEDNLINDNTSVIHNSEDGDNNNHISQSKQQDKKQPKEVKLHFKEIMDL